MPGKVWVLAEVWRGEVTEITYEALALGRDLAGQMGVPLEAVLLGRDGKTLAASLGAASRVLVADHPALADAAPEPYAEALAQLARRECPAAILTPLTNVSLGIGTLAAAKLGAPAINFCQDVRFEDRRIVAHCLLYGGKIEADVAAAGEPAVLGIWPGARPAEAGRSEQPPAVVEELAVDLPAAAPVRLREVIEPEAGEVDVTQQEALVAVGRGIGSQDNIAVATELADLLGGAVCGSRPVIDQGWLALSRQVGKSGATVKPKLYIAAGVSGAPEHVEGMRGAGTIVAINTDPHAPIFGVAHLGIVGDAAEVLAAMAEAIRGRHGKAAA
ncbi:MAG: electron transfer flavoprotein subunit alpha/FixB family protein [Acidobacteria bacterium]|nr:electron transfer flavoprotein subunit alpha/FixB family protein [Acidobacteriota bacterium]